MVDALEKAGLKFVGTDESGKRMEVSYLDFALDLLTSITVFLSLTSFRYLLCVLQILELPNHPFYVCVQFHPEFKSRPGRPSAPFLGI